jgi:Uma2 family endonuclease
MSTISEIKSVLRTLSLEDRQVIAGWLEGYQEHEPLISEVREPAAEYAVELPYMTVEEFLEFAERSPTRHEYVNGFVHAMNGASMAHNRIESRLYKAIEKGLGGGPCEIFLSGLTLKVDTASDKQFLCPDLMVSCDREGWREKWLLNPRLIVEVLSPSTQHIDRREKAATYRRIPSVEEYVIVAQSSWQLTILRRAEDWVPKVVSGPEAVAEFQSLGISVPLAEVYCGVFSEPASAERQL